MKFFLGRSTQQAGVDRIRQYKDFYEFKKTVSHGFPANPTCIAYDQYHKLLAIGTKNASIQIYGKPGVEFHYQFEDEFEIFKIFFITNSAKLLIIGADCSIYLLKIPTRPSQQGIIKVNSFEELAQNENLEMTTVALNLAQDILFIGFKNGQIQMFNLKTFKLNNEILSLENILKLIPTELKLKPGSVEVIEEQPNNQGNILIGYSRCLIALWDYKNKKVENYFTIEQQLEHLSWNKNGQEFVSCHNDGSYNIWSVKQEHHNCKNTNSKLPYGPFPCKAIRKINWDTSSNGEYFIFSGGMPRLAYSDKETVSIIQHSNQNDVANNEKNVVLDFSSKIVDFLIIFSGTDEEDSEPIPKALVVLAVEEIVVIDLLQNDWPQFKLPYLACLHSSPITCSQYCSNVQANVYKNILTSSETETNLKYSKNEWPINGGVEAPYINNDNDNTASNNNDTSYHLLLTGHEDGTVRFWDASTIALKHLYTINTSKLFNVNDDDLALLDGDEEHELSNDGNDENEWPPFRKVGQFDPYSDDPRLAIRKLSFCSEQGILCVGGTAGQLIVLEFKNKNGEITVNFTEVKIIDEKDSFVWKGRSCLTARKTNMKYNIGYQPSCLIQLNPPAAITALQVSTCWKVIGVGTAHGFSMFDYSKNTAIIAKSTLKPSNLHSVMGGDALISRRKSFKKSLRESFRRLRRSRSQKSKRNLNIKNATATQSAGALSAVAKESSNNRMMMNKKFIDANNEPKPIERPIEAKSNEDTMGSMVKCLYFCSSSILSSQLCPTFWVGTNAGMLFIYVLINDKNSSSSSLSWQLAKEVQVKHKAPIIFIRLIDNYGRPLFENHHPPENNSTSNNNNEKYTLRLLICSEEQFKSYSLPNFKAINKFKLTAHEGARVRRIDIGKFPNKSNDRQQEYSLMCLTNLGDVNIFSPIDFRRKFQHHFIKKEDINAISSLIFTETGEGLYLKSSSEYQRFALSAKKINFLECYIRLTEDNLLAEGNSGCIDQLNSSKETNGDQSEENENQGNNSSKDDSMIRRASAEVIETIIQTVVSDQQKAEDLAKIQNGLATNAVGNSNGSGILFGSVEHEI